MKKVKITKKYLADWVEKQLSEVGFNYKVIKIVPVQHGKYSQGDFTIKTRVLIQSNDSAILRLSIPCWYSLKELENELDSNSELFLDWKSGYGAKWISNCEINIRKIK